MQFPFLGSVVLHKQHINTPPEWCHRDGLIGPPPKETVAVHPLATFDMAVGKVGEKPAMLKCFQAYARGFNDYLNTFAEGKCIPVKDRSIEVEKALITIVEYQQRSPWREFDGRDFRNMVVKYHNDHIRYERAQAKKKANRRRQPKPAEVRGKRSQFKSAGEDDEVSSLHIDKY